jgi:molecular chaperone Hsp33
MNDRIHRFLFEGLDIRGALVQISQAWQAMHSGRGYTEASRRLLGELSAVTTIIACNLKTPGRLTFQIQGHGPVRLAIVDCDERLRLRGMLKAPEQLMSGTAPELLGDGRLVLTLDSNAATQPYQSIVPLKGDNLAQAFEHYLSQSEQAPARLWLSADQDRACGLFMQKLPGADARDPDGWNRLQQLAATLRPQELALPAETLLTRLFPDEEIRLFDPRPVSYHCPRDEAKVLDMLRSLGREEIETTLAEHGEIVVHDDICNQEYRFTAEILELLYAPASRTLH